MIASIIRNAQSMPVPSEGWWEAIRSEHGLTGLIVLMGVFFIFAMGWKMGGPFLKMIVAQTELANVLKDGFPRIADMFREWKADHDEDIREIKSGVDELRRRSRESV